MNIDAFPMETDDNNEQHTDVQLSREEQSPTIVDIDLDGINEVLIRNNISLQCRSVFKIDNVAIAEFKILNDLLPDLLKLNRKILCEKVFRKISAEQMEKVLYDDIRNWLESERSLLVVKFLPYLSLACDMKFHECTIKKHKDRRVFVPIERNHEISTAIYYICDSSRQTIKGIFITHCAYTLFAINRYHRLLMQEPLHNTNKIDLYKALISNYTKQVKTLRFHQHLLLLSKWQEIYSCYKAMERLGYRLSSIETLHYSRCLIMSSKYSAAEMQIQSLLSDKIVKSDVAWYLHALAQRKRKQYSNIEKERMQYENYLKAKTSISMALTVNPTGEKILKEKTIIYNLRERISRREATLEYTINPRRRADNCLSYNILSIDGGGIRGIMAAIWLNELERKTNRLCSTMFQMMAGTSTGAIIAAGLSTPEEYSLTRPAHKISDLVKLYEERGKEIFVQKTYPFYSVHNIPIPLQTKYSSDGKRKIFDHHFSNTLLRECLTDIVIPSVKTGDAHTYLFTRNNCLASTRLVDVLMATTAAPTYFDPHLIDNTYYIDGGVQMNNPTLAAYTKAIEYGHDRSNIFVLSLGTGDYLRDPLVSDNERNLLFYLTHYKTVFKTLIDSEEHNVDYQMNSLMDDEHYYRWQVWLEGDIKLDMYESETVNKLKNIAYEYWEEMEIYDDNRLNRLIERLKQE